MEAALAAEDPKLVNTLRGTGVRRVHRRRAAIAGIGFFAGLALLIAGISVTPFLSVLGFMIMVAAAVTAIYSWQHVGNSPDAARGRDRAKTAQGVDQLRVLSRKRSLHLLEKALLLIREGHWPHPHLGLVVRLPSS